MVNHFSSPAVDLEERSLWSLEKVLECELNKEEGLEGGGGGVMRNKKGDRRGCDLTERGDDLLGEKFVWDERMTCVRRLVVTVSQVNLWVSCCGGTKKPHVVCLQGWTSALLLRSYARRGKRQRQPLRMHPPSLSHPLLCAAASQLDLFFSPHDLLSASL